MTRSCSDAFARRLLPAILLLPALTGCLGGGSSPSNVPGTGRAGFVLESVEWGRLVDVFDQDGQLVERDVVIRESLRADGVDYVLGVNALTQSDTLTILASAGTTEFESLLNAARSGRSAVSAKGFNDPSPFTRVARNGAVRLQFSELVDPDSVDRQTVQVLVGNPPTKSLEVRYVVKNGVLGADGKPKGVLILDPTVSRFDQAQYGIPENGLGFPASFNQQDPNIIVRIPTQVDVLFGQLKVLTNLAGNHHLEPQPSDPIELSPSFDPIVVRAFRSGNTDDPYNGFMVDQVRPQLITEQPVDVLRVDSVAGSPSLRTLTYSIAVAGCREITPKVGDLFEVGGGVVLVSRVEDASNPDAYKVTGAVLTGTVDPTGVSQQGRLTSAYDEADYALQACWLSFSPEPMTLPSTGLDPYATTVTVRFNEAVDPVTVQSMETMVLCSFVDTDDPAENARRYNPTLETVGDFIDRQVGFQTEAGTSGSGRILFGPIEVSPDSREYTLAPLAGLTDAHDEGNGMRLCLALRDGRDGILDLAGNTVDFNRFVAGTTYQQDHLLTLSGDPATWPSDRYFALRFNSLDEDGDGLSEYGGQFTFIPGILKGRDINRFSRVADPKANAFIGQRIAFSQGVMTPLTPTGAALVTVYGYHHLNFGLLAPSEYNLDVEGLNWSPFGGAVFDDVFGRYALALAHSRYYPDDLINQQTGYPAYPNSGLLRQQVFKNNVLGRGQGYLEKVVFDAPYVISGVNMFSAVTGSSMMPWPTFQDTYTWRDTAIPQSITGAPNSGGVPPAITGQTVVYRAGDAPSIGLPLLMWFKCYPEGNYFGLNGFQVQIMVPSSALPAFRIFSAGGRDASDNWHLVIPDQPPEGEKPSGGYNTATGAKTKAYGPELYWGQVDFVVKVSRVYTHWFAFGGILDTITPVTSEPAPERQPPGTEVVVEFRGTSTLDTSLCPPDAVTIVNDTNCLDAYGDVESNSPCNPCPGTPQPTDWTRDTATFLSSPTPPTFFQLRFTFVSNTVQDFESELDAFGFAWNVRP